MGLLGSSVVIGAPGVDALEDSPWRLPVTPPRCTTAEADSGDVGHCLLAFYHDPSDTGWGQPPAPGVGDGWAWTGSTYAGSPALATWEAEQIAENTETVAGLAPSVLETHVAAQPLFEGFLREIAANGYEVRHASGYSFRCTSGNGGWSCPSGDPDDLSNHAWGLAVDMNSGTNPIRRYSSVDGQTACLTPMDTDFPQWAIQVAEKWGLYWGGYGWNSGCQDTTTQRTSVYRDPPHFEFRGTVDQARAIAAFNLRNDPASTCFTVVDDAGLDTERCTWTGIPEAGWRLPIETDVPAGTAAVMINLTATEGASDGALTVEDCGPRAGARTTTALTYAAGDSVASMAVAEIDEAGRFCVFRSSAVHSIVDVVGLMTADGEPLWFEPTEPTRLTDTRADGTCGPQPAECAAGPVPDRAVHTVPTTDTRPRLANVTVIEGAGPGFVQAGSCDAVGDGQNFSNLNYLDAGVSANLALVDNNERGSCVYALTETHVIVDELGALDTEAGYGWSMVEPRRALDTRACDDTWCADRPAARDVIELDLATDAAGAAVAITVTETQGPGFVAIGPCAAFADRQNIETSNVNFLTGESVTNLALVDLDEGRVCIFTLEAAHIAVDVQAELVEAHDLGLAPIDPYRPHDSRDL